MKNKKRCKHENTINYKWNTPKLNETHIVKCRDCKKSLIAER